MSDQSILAELQNETSMATPTLEDGFFDDIWNGVKSAGNDVWNGVTGKATETAKNAVGKEIDSIFGNEQTPPYDDMSQSPPIQTQQNTQIQQQQQQPQQKDSFIKKIPPVAVGAVGTGIARFGFKLGWITSLAIGAGAGTAKHYLIDKK